MSRIDPWTVGPVVAVVVLVGAMNCTVPPPQATSLLGERLDAPKLPKDRQARLQADADAAAAVYRESPHDEQAAIWYGRRLAYLGQFRAAIAIFTDGLKDHPDSYRLLRHRGHRYITVREFDAAIADLERAATLVEDVPDEVEPDGQPNAKGIPRSTVNGNIEYHLGLARYLKGEFASAADAYRRCLALAHNDDVRCAAVNWLYLSLRRAGRDTDAALAVRGISRDMDVIENVAYHQLALVYVGQRDADAVLTDFSPGTVEWITASYGVGAWRLCNGGKDAAEFQFRRIVRGDNWPAFGFIAAEAELARMQQQDGRE